MKTAAERMRESLGKPREMTSISLRIPERVVDDLKEVAPMLGFSGYQSLIKAYISQGLRKDLEQLEGSNTTAFTESLRKHGVSDDIIAAAVAEMQYPQIRLSRQAYKQVESFILELYPNARVFFTPRLDAGINLLFDVTFPDDVTYRVQVSSAYVALGEWNSVREELADQLKQHLAMAS